MSLNALTCTRCKQAIKEDQHSFVQFACKQRHRYHTTCFNEKQPLPQQCLECEMYSPMPTSSTTIDIPVGKIFQAAPKKKEVELDDGFRVDDGDVSEHEGLSDGNTRELRSRPNAASFPLFSNPATYHPSSSMALVPSVQPQMYSVPSTSSTVNIHTFPQYTTLVSQPMQPQHASIMPQLQSQQPFQSMSMPMSMPLQMPPQYLPPMSTISSSSSFNTTPAANPNDLLQSISMSSMVTYAAKPTLFSAPSLPQHNKFTHQSSPRQYWIVLREQTDNKNVSIEDDPRAWLKVNKPFISTLQSRRYFYQKFAAAGVTLQMWKDLYRDVSGYKRWSSMQQQLPPGFMETKFYDEHPALQ